jgi:hypothetical protein
MWDKKTFAEKVGKDLHKIRESAISFLNIGEKVFKVQACMDKKFQIKNEQARSVGQGIFN